MSPRTLLLGASLLAAAALLVAIVSSGDAPSVEPARPGAAPPSTGTPGPAPPAEPRAAEPPAPPSPERPAEGPAPRPPSESEAAKRERLARVMREYLDALEIPDAVAAAAKALDVSAEALREMYGCELLLHYAGGAPADEVLRGVADEWLARLAGRGDEGFLSVVANACGNPGNSSRVDLMAEATWRPGLEKSLIEWLEASPPSTTVTAPIRALGGIDSEDARRFLRDALSTYADHASNFSAAAAAAGRLGYGDAAGPVAAKLREPRWSGVRPALLDSLGRMGGDDARRILVEYLRDPDGGSESAGLLALARIDPVAARAEAGALLAGSSNPLTEVERDRVRRLAEELDR